MFSMPMLESFVSALYSLGDSRMGESHGKNSRLFECYTRYWKAGYHLRPAYGTSKTYWLELMLRETRS
jgi:hypothetical protein